MTAQLIKDRWLRRQELDRVKRSLSHEVRLAMTIMQPTATGQRKLIVIQPQPRWTQMSVAGAGGGCSGE